MFLPAEVAGIIDPTGNVLIPGVCQGVMKGRPFFGGQLGVGVWIDVVKKSSYVNMCLFSTKLGGGFNYFLYSSQNLGK